MIGLIVLWTGIGLLISMAIFQSVFLGVIAIIFVGSSVVFIIYEMQKPIEKQSSKNSLN